MSLRLHSAMLIAACGATVGYAQERNRPPRLKTREQLLELANPGTEHRELARYSGDWTTEVRLGAGQSAKVYSGTAQIRMVAGERFLQCEYKAARKDEAASGVLTLGFDRRHTEYTIQSVDTWGTYFVTARGKRTSDSGLIKLYGTDDDPHMKSMGLTKEFAFAIDLTKENELTVKVYMIDNRTPKRRELLMMEYVFDKTKN